MMGRKNIELTLERALDSGASFAELFFEDKEEMNIQYDSAVRGIAHMRVSGAGLYVINGTKSVYSYTNNLTMPSMLAMADMAKEILGIQQLARTPEPVGTVKVAIEEPCPVLRYPGNVPQCEKIAVLEKADKKARSVTPFLRSIRLDFFDTDQRVMIANSEGVLAQDRRVTSRLRIVPVVANSKGSTGHFSDWAYPAGFEAFEDGTYLAGIERVLKDMEASLDADEAPSGVMPVILEGGGCTGTFFHEACGHQLETTQLRRNGIFWDRRGQKVASEKVTLIDDGTLPCMYGSSKFDDEGMPRQRNVLIKGGVLQGFLADRLGSIVLGLPRSGSGRRQGYANAPGPRMSNTFLAPGNDDEDEMIRSLDSGLFVTELGGGSGGKEFTIMARTAFLIENGEVGRRVRGAMLLGRGDETMLKIDRVGGQMVFDDGGSFCGNESGFLPTTTSGPRMRIQGMVVGGKGGAAQ